MMAHVMGFARPAMAIFIAWARTKRDEDYVLSSDPISLGRASQAPEIGYFEGNLHETVFRIIPAASDSDSSCPAKAGHPVTTGPRI